MTVDEKSMRTFFTQVADSFSENGFKQVEIEISENELINNKECFFIHKDPFFEEKRLSNLTPHPVAVFLYQ